MFLFRLLSPWDIFNARWNHIQQTENSIFKTTLRAISLLSNSYRCEMLGNFSRQRKQSNLWFNWIKYVQIFNVLSWLIENVVPHKWVWLTFKSCQRYPNFKIYMSTIGKRANREVIFRAWSMLLLTVYNHLRRYILINHIIWTSPSRNVNSHGKYRMKWVADVYPFKVNENVKCFTHPIKFTVLTYQYCHIFLAWNGKLHNANVSNTTTSIRITPLLARSTLFVEFDTCINWAPPWWRLWKLWLRHVVTIIFSDSTDTWEQKERRKKMKGFIVGE